MVERVGGYLGRVIAAVIRRSQVRSALADVMGRATIRRRALEDMSAAVTYLIARLRFVASSRSVMRYVKEVF